MPIAELHQQVRKHKSGKYCLYSPTSIMRSLVLC